MSLWCFWYFSLFNAVGLLLNGPVVQKDYLSNIKGKRHLINALLVIQSLVWVVNDALSTLYLRLYGIEHGKERDVAQR